MWNNHKVTHRQKQLPTGNNLTKCKFSCNFRSHKYLSYCCYYFLTSPNHEVQQISLIRSLIVTFPLQIDFCTCCSTKIEPRASLRTRRQSGHQHWTPNPFTRSALAQKYIQHCVNSYHITTHFGIQCSEIVSVWNVNK